MADLHKKIFPFITSFLLFIFTEPALAKMNRAPADLTPPIPSSYNRRHLASDVQDAERWLKDGLCEPTSESLDAIERIHSTLKEIQEIRPK
ncbi:MAG: hypothetical protein AAB309_01445 [Deltaproteobacteria bacterium]